MRMYIRIKKSSHSKHKVVLLQESFRDNGKPKQRLIKHIGTAKNDEELEQLKDIAETLKIQLTQKKLAMTETITFGANFGEKCGQMIDVSKNDLLDPTMLKEESRQVLGIHDVYGYIYDLLNFTNPFPYPKRRSYAATILREIVLARIAKPCSKRASVEMLKQDFGVKLNLDHVYQMMDKIDEKFCDRIQERALAATLKLTGDKLKVLFYDATTLYFESFTEDELKQNGYSKDMKFNQPQLLLALFVTKSGLPVGYELFPGATYEGHTLKPVLEKLKKRYQIDEMVFVADRGMLSNDNLDYLEKNKIPYIVGARLRNLKKSLQKEILDWKHNGISDTKAIEINGKKLILSYNDKRARKDKADREKSVSKLYEKISKNKNPKTVISNFGYQKYLQIEGDVELTVNEEKLANEARWDGLSGIFAHQDDLTNEEALSHYRSLWQVEESFRITKHDLRIRPIYHWSPGRVRAHIAISFMAFACIRHLEYRVNLQYKKMSPEAIRTHLLRVQATVIENQKTHRRYLLPSRTTPEARNIYRVANAKIPDKMQQIL